MAKFQLSIGEDKWVLDLGTMKISEVEQCEALTGWDVEKWRDALIDNRARAVKFAVWLAQTRGGDSPAWKDLDFDMAALDWAPLDDDGNVIPPADLGVTEDDAESVPTGPQEEQQPLDAA